MKTSAIFATLVLFLTFSSTLQAVPLLDMYASWGVFPYDGINPTPPTWADTSGNGTWIPRGVVIPSPLVSGPSYPTTPSQTMTYSFSGYHQFFDNVGGNNVDRFYPSPAVEALIDAGSTRMAVMRWESDVAATGVTITGSVYSRENQTARALIYQVNATTGAYTQIFDSGTLAAGNPGTSVPINLSGLTITADTYFDFAGVDFDGGANSWLIWDDVVGSGTLAAETVPEPSTFVLAALGLAGLGLFAWRKTRKISVV